MTDEEIIKRDKEILKELHEMGIPLYFTPGPYRLPGSIQKMVDHVIAEKEERDGKRNNKRDGKEDKG